MRSPWPSSTRTSPPRASAAGRRLPPRNAPLTPPMASGFDADDRRRVRRPDRDASQGDTWASSWHPGSHRPGPDRAHGAAVRRRRGDLPRPCAWAPARVRSPAALPYSCLLTPSQGASGSPRRSWPRVSGAGCRVLPSPVEAFRAMASVAVAAGVRPRSSRARPVSSKGSRSTASMPSTVARMTLLADLAEAPIHDDTPAVARLLEPPQHPPSSMARGLCSTAATAARPRRRALGAGLAWAAAEGGVLGVCRAASSEAGRRRGVGPGGRGALAGRCRRHGGLGRARLISLNPDRAGALCQRAVTEYAASARLPRGLATARRTSA